MSGPLAIPVLPTNTGDPMLDLAGTQVFLSQALGALMTTQKIWMDDRTKFVQRVNDLSNRLFDLKPTTEPDGRTAAGLSTIATLGKNAADSANIIAQLKAFGVDVDMADVTTSTTGPWTCKSGTIDAWKTNLNSYVESLNSETQKEQAQAQQTMQEFNNSLGAASDGVKARDTTIKSVQQNARG